MVNEDAATRAGSFWKTINQPNTLCDNCHDELPLHATVGHGKHAVADIKKQRVVYYCNRCYYYYTHRNDPDVKERRKWR